MVESFKLNHITKIEGHAKLHVVIEDGVVEEVKIEVFEGSRYFEGILKGKKANDLSHISSRICGICSVVHAITAVGTVEKALGVNVSEQTKKLRELLNIGGTIQSHALHLYFLTLPDYAGVDNALELAKQNKELIGRALRIKKIGNSIVRTVAGRDVHPITCVVGGFSVLPKQEELKVLKLELESVVSDCEETIKLFAGLSYPDLNRTSSQFSLTGGPYFYSHKIIKCQDGECFETDDYKEHIKEHLRAESTAEFAMLDGKNYFVGALPRILNGRKKLNSKVKELGRVLFDSPKNPYMNIVAQAMEMLQGVQDAIKILDAIKIEPEEPTIYDENASGEGVFACEAPRGIVFHQYEIENGHCVGADITTPTSQNLEHLEESIRELLPLILDLGPDEIKREIEKLIRAYDPCISCSTHFLELNIEYS